MRRKLTRSFECTPHRPRLTARVPVPETADGRRVALAARKGLVGVFDAQTGRRLFEHRALSGLRSSDALAFGGGGRWLAMAGGGSWHTLALDLETGRLRRVKGPGQPRGVSVSADGRWVATAHENGAVTLWDPSRDQAEVLPLRAGGLALGGDGQLFLRQGRSVWTWATPRRQRF